MNNLKKTIMRTAFLIIFSSNFLFGMTYKHTEADLEFLEALKNRTSNQVQELYNALSQALNQGANINMPFAQQPDTNCLFYAIEKDNFLLFSYLLNKKIDANKQNNQGTTPAHLLFYHDLKSRVLYLQRLHKYGADLNIPDKKGMTPLHAAVVAQDKESVQYLLSIGVDPDAQDNNKQSPLDYANKSNNEDLINLLTNLDNIKYKAEPQTEQDKQKKEIFKKLYHNICEINNNNKFEKSVIFKFEPKEYELEFLSKSITDKKTLETIGEYILNNNFKITYYKINHNPLKNDFAKTIIIDQKQYYEKQQTIENLWKTVEEGRFFSDNTQFPRTTYLQDLNIYYGKKCTPIYDKNYNYHNSSKKEDGLLYTHDMKSEQQGTPPPSQLRDIERDYDIQQKLFSQFYELYREDEKEKMKEFTIPEYFNINFIYLNRYNL